MCAWFEPGPGVPEVVHGFAGLLYPLCALHRRGIQVPDGRRTKITDLSPDALRSRLLDQYAVDPIPFESVAWLFSQPRTPDPPAYFPSIHPVSS